MPLLIVHPPQAAIPNKVRSTHASVQFPFPRRWLVGLLILLLVAALAWWLWPAATPAHKEAGGGGRGGKGMGMMGGRPGFGGSSEAVPVRVEPVRVGDFPCITKPWAQSLPPTRSMCAAVWLANW